MAPTRSGAAADAARLSFAFARKAALVSASTCVLGGAIAGCLSRPVVGQPTTTTAVVTVENRQTVVSKIDLLFMIDDSLSMKDKQDYLNEAVPKLIKRLVTPNCVDENNPTRAPYGPSNDDGTCAQGQPEFKAVKDIHIGIVTSSLGGHGGNLCTTPEGNTQGHLSVRGANGSPQADADGSKFLAWFPAGGNAGPGVTPITDKGKLVGDFADMVQGVGQNGCGLEAQLESWYRFLVQPDPYETLDAPGDVAKLEGVDMTILKQRHDFLRPDSLVAIIDLTDENDSEIDALAVSGNAWRFMMSAAPIGPQGAQKWWNPPRATSACAQSLDSPDCTWCGFVGHESDPSCQKGAYTTDAAALATTDHGDLNLLDNPNLRHVHMKEKYGIDPQFPLSRYVTGLTSPKVPDSKHEHARGGYAPTLNCQNPLFAASLPDGTSKDADLCNLPASRRTKDLVFYAHIGGVPASLLHFDPNDAQKRLLTDDDWTKILGKDPDRHDRSGIDPHMIESATPRQAIPGPTDAPTDLVVGRDYVSSRQNGGSDLMYACTFELKNAKDCSHDTSGVCDCPTTAQSWQPGEIPPVCDPSNPTQQTRARAYPTIRELELAKLLGSQGVISSICPIHVRPEGGNDEDPFYGYTPAVYSIIDRLKTGLRTVCLPHGLSHDVKKDDNRVHCVVVETLATPGDESACASIPGRTPPSDAVLSQLRNQQREAAGGGGADLTSFPVCEVAQLGQSDYAGATCRGADKPGWCYVDGAAAGVCAQGIQFSDKGASPSGAAVSMVCLESTN